MFLKYKNSNLRLYLKFIHRVLIAVDSGAFSSHLKILGERHFATSAASASQTPARASFAFAAERMTRFYVVREHVYRSSSTSLVKLLRGDYDVIQVEARRSERARAVTTRGWKLCEYIENGANRRMWDREGECDDRISESALTVINPLNKVIEDSRGSVEVNLRRL